MIEVSTLVVLIMAEIFVGLVILSGLLLLFMILRKRRIRLAANHLTERIQQDHKKRTDRLKKVLQECYHHEGVSLDQTLRNIEQTELTLYQNIINGFLKDDHIYLKQMDVDVENLVLGYQSLGVAQEKVASPETATITGDSEELQRLQSENKRLSEELKVTMDTMGRMLNEYSTMFSSGVDFSGGGVDSAPSASPAAAPDVASQQPENIEEAQIQKAPEESSGDLSPMDTQQPMDVDEEVSEIIDEVMEMADEMIQEAESSQEPQAGESMVDDLTKIDIEIPDMGVDDSTVENSELASGSLEEEWAKLLEEESPKKPD
jgi:hypothetical protein